MSAVRDILIMLAVVAAIIIGCALVRWGRSQRNRRRVMPRTAADDRSTPLRTTPRVTTPRGESESGGDMSPITPRSPRWSPASPPTPLSPERIEELQPADEEHALAFAVERSLSYRASEPSAEDADARERARQQSAESELVAALHALPSQPWTPALARRQRDAPTSAAAVAAAAAPADADGNASTVETPPCKSVLDDTDECSMCMDAFAEGDMVKMLKCRHYFHAACIDDWFAHQQGKTRTCPVCSSSPI